MDDEKKEDVKKRRGRAARSSPIAAESPMNGSQIPATYEPDAAAPLDLSQVDGRTRLARRYRDHVDALSAQAGGSPSPAQEILIRRVVSMVVQLEMEDAKLMSGMPIDSTLYARTANIVSVLLAKLGMARLNKDGKRGDVLIDQHSRALLDA
ncbi:MULTISPECIES: hypothetical protein [unclassified Inquilinus]|uniref:hypothetical protein n=1 Tax=unclassified Inquilinus TaxID=2645927 RepID=UPI003F927484